MLRCGAVQCSAVQCGAVVLCCVVAVTVLTIVICNGYITSRTRRTSRVSLVVVFIQLIYFQQHSLFGLLNSIEIELN